MCGIVGMLGNPSKNLIKKMGEAIHHRGPDDTGYYFDPEIALGAKRLSIIDLGGGHQPMPNENETIWVVQNGEIYNYQELKTQLVQKGHQFKSRCDTELLVHAYEEWGDQFVNHLRGMFALALWDQNKKQLILCRDRLGIKPLYLWTNHKTLCFSSEIRGLLQNSEISRELSLEGIHHYLTLQNIPAPLTIFKNIQAFKPGEIRIYSFSQGYIREIKRDVFWNPNLLFYFPQKSFHSIQEVSECLQEKLIESIKLHLMSDVPLGLFLSGGLDSTLLLALIRKSFSGPIKTLTIGWEEESKTKDERLGASEVAQIFSTNHEEILLNGKMVEKEFYPFLEALDQPSFDGLNSYFISKAAGKKLKVALSGMGGDELTLGYSYVSALKKLEQFENGTKWIPNPLIQFFLQNFQKKQKRFLRLSSLWNQSLPYKLSQVGFSVFSPEQKKNLENPFLFSDLFPTEMLIARSLSGKNLTDRLMAYGFQIYLPCPLLRDIDVMSMWHSLEVRVPYLDHELIEFFYQLPEKFKFKKNHPKFLFHKIAEKLLPPSVFGPKKGFTLPMNEWLRGSLKPIVEDSLSDFSIQKRNFFQKEEVRKIKKQFFENQGNYSQVWSLTLLEQWLRQFGN